MASFQERISEPGTWGLGGTNIRCDAIFVLMEFVHIAPYIKVEHGYEKKGQPGRGFILKYHRLPHNCDYSTRPNFQPVCVDA